jgi:Flp pilus assembly protein TadB
MTTEEQMKFSQRYARFNTQPQSLLGKVLTLVLGAAFLVLAFMFSLVALAVVAVGGTLLWGWLWWETRAIRKQMREQGPGFPPQPTEGNIIDGEVIRDTDAPPQSGRLLR